MCKANADDEPQCDETLPACLNCTRRALQCSFNKSPPQARGNPDKESRQGASSTSPKSPLELLDRLPGYGPGACSGVSFQRITEDEDFEITASPPLSVMSSVAELAPMMSAADRELLQHFETFTSRNLALSKTAWRTKVLRNALQVRTPFYYSRSLTPAG
jgi:hypothetical protein